MAKYNMEAPFSKENNDFYENLGKRMMTDFSFDETVSEIDFMSEVMLQEFMENTSEGQSVDTIVADYLFLQGFITLDMEDDFDLITQDFLEKAGSHLKEFSLAYWYDFDDIREVYPPCFYQTKILTAIYNGARLGNEYCLSLMKSLYMTYYKKEYRVLKRFKEISAPEILDFDIIGDGELSRIYTYARILCMSRIFGIRLHPNCNTLFIFLEKNYQILVKARDAYRNNQSEFDDDLYDECEEQIDLWVGDNRHKKAYKKVFKPYFTDLEFAKKYLSDCNLPKEYLHHCNPFAEDAELSMLNALTTLKKEYPSRSFTFEEVQHYSALVALIDTVSEISKSYENAMEAIFFHETPEERKRLGGGFFKPVNVSSSAASVKKPAERPKILSTVADSHETKEEFLVEIEDLKRRLGEKDRALKNLKSLYQDSKKEAQQAGFMKERYDALHEEVISLRNFVFQSEDEEEEIADTEKLSRMKKAVEKKKIMLIGGHIAWQNKLKKEFPDWIYIHTDASGLIDPKLMENMDMVYFYTKYLSHQTYERYIGMAREREIPFGYVKNVNLDRLIVKIYEDLCS